MVPCVLCERYASFPATLGRFRAAIRHLADFKNSANSLKKFEKVRFNAATTIFLPSNVLPIAERKSQYESLGSIAS